MAEVPKFNLRNPAVKRIMQEIKEIKQDTSGDFIAEALETDIFEWHFVIRGPRDTEFEGGIFHGRILLPAEYPFKPPSFMMLSPNGRFETGVKICLSISSHHPEHWQPSWSVRTALTALIAFMPSPGAGALGALDFPKEERRQLAARSRAEAPRFGSAERQRVIDEMHARMLAIAAEKDAERAAASSAGQGSAAEGGACSGADQTPEAALAAESASPSAASHAGRQGEAHAETVAGDQVGAAAASASAATNSQAAATAVLNRPSTSQAASPLPAAPARDQPSTRAPAAAASASAPTPVASNPAHVPAAPAAWTPGPGPVPLPAAAAAAVAPTSTDHMLTALMWALYVGIGAILLRKVMGAMGVDLTDILDDLMH